MRNWLPLARITSFSFLVEKNIREKKTAVVEKGGQSV
jgi:hypothetical protein